MRSRHCGGMASVVTAARTTIPSLPCILFLWSCHWLLIPWSSHVVLFIGSRSWYWPPGALRRWMYVFPMYSFATVWPLPICRSLIASVILPTIVSLVSSSWLCPQMSTKLSQQYAAMGSWHSWSKVHPPLSAMLKFRLWYFKREGFWLLMWHLASWEFLNLCVCYREYASKGCCLVKGSWNCFEKSIFNGENCLHCSSDSELV